jgi:hypothetical protein
MAAGFPDAVRKGFKVRSPIGLMAICKALYSDRRRGFFVDTHLGGFRGLIPFNPFFLN